jgi:pyrroloquinoline quinone biosynthesis protein D
MTAGPVLAADSVPRLAPHARLRRDAVRGVWAVQAPERTFMLDETAHAVLARCDGATTLDGIVDRLCGAFPDAPRATIAADVAAMLQDLADKGVILA